MKPVPARLLSAALRRRWHASTRNRGRQGILAAVTIADLANQVEELDADNQSGMRQLVGLRREIQALEEKLIHKEKEIAVLHLRCGTRPEGNILRLPPPTVEPMPILSFEHKGGGRL